MRKFHEIQLQELKEKLTKIENFHKIETQKLQVNFDLKIQEIQRENLKKGRFQKMKIQI